MNRIEILINTHFLAFPINNGIVTFFVVNACKGQEKIWVSNHDLID